jgi:hypothetical protein
MPGPGPYRRDAATLIKTSLYLFVTIISTIQVFCGGGEFMGRRFGKVRWYLKESLSITALRATGYLLFLNREYF